MCTSKKYLFTAKRSIRIHQSVQSILTSRYWRNASIFFYVFFPPDHKPWRVCPDIARLTLIKLVGKMLLFKNLIFYCRFIEWYTVSFQEFNILLAFHRMACGFISGIQYFMAFYRTRFHFSNLTFYWRFIELYHFRNSTFYYRLSDCIQFHFRNLIFYWRFIELYTVSF